MVSIGGNTAAAAAASAATAAVAAKGRANGSNGAHGEGGVANGKVQINLFKRSSDLRSTAKAASQRGARHRIFFHNRLNHLQGILGATIQEAENEEEARGGTRATETEKKEEAGVGGAAAEGARGVTVAEEVGNEDDRDYLKEVAAVAVCMGVGAVEMKRWEAEYEYLIQIEGLQVRGRRIDKIY